MRRTSLVLLTLPLLLLGGCYVDDDDFGHCSACSGGMGGADYGWSPDAATSTIDAGASMDQIYAGEDVGAYVEYQGQGSWYVYTSCDTLTSERSCNWVIEIVTSSGGFTSLDPDRLTVDDFYQTDGNFAWMDVVTTSEIDGMVVTTDADASVQVAVWLDGEPGNRWLYWVGDEAVHSGAATNPIGLVPQG